MPICNYCGKEIKSEHGLAVHIAKLHGEKRIGNKKHKTILLSAPSRDLEQWKELAKRRKKTVSGLVRETMFNEIQCENIGYSNLKTLKDENRELKQKLILLEGGSIKGLDKIVDAVDERKLERDEWNDYKNNILDDLPDWVNPKDAEAILVMRKQNQQAQFEEYRNLEHLKKQFNRLPAGKRKAVKKLMLSDGVLLDEALGMVMG